MNSFEINKILGALLGTCLVLVVVHIASGAIFEPAPPAKPGYEIAVTEEKGAGKVPTRLWEQATAADNLAAQLAETLRDGPLETLLSTASTERGAQVAKQCQICHNLQEGQGAKVGPDLYGFVGSAVAAAPNSPVT